MTPSSITELTEWRALAKHQQEITHEHMRDWFANDASRFPQFSLQAGDILLDYSRNRIANKTVQLLADLAQAAHLPKKIAALLAGHPVNITEKRPALHTALRDKTNTALTVNGENIASLVAKTRAQMHLFVDKIREEQWQGVTGKSIAHIVNIGIGGSHFGPMMCTQALADFTAAKLHCHFVSSVDKAQLNEVLKQIDPEKTLFIISSKSFSTLETLTNARTVVAWMKNQLGEKVLDRHFIAVTAAKEKAMQFGIPEEHILPLWDWVGGRYSVWSAIGLPLAILIGNQHFSDFLDGAYQMDQHFREADLTANMPVLLALLSIWYMNFFAATTQAIVPYSHCLRHLPTYLQQAEMESNGKSISQQGHAIEYATSPIIFGQEGCDGQHAYHQLLHQGRHLVPVDFILIGKNHGHEHDLHQDILIASGLSQAQALMRGKTYNEAREELLVRHYSESEANFLAHHQMIAGNKPSNILFLNQLTPNTLGALLALYEHKIYVQGAIWNINSFDQWGVELGKQLIPPILDQLQGTQTKGEPLDCATAGLIDYYKKLK